MRKLRQTISFDEEASRIIDTAEPRNLSDYVSKAVAFYAASEIDVQRGIFNAKLEELRKDLHKFYPGHELNLEKTGHKGAII